MKTSNPILKKSIVTLIIIVVTIITVKSQNLTIGFTAGVNCTTLRNKNIDGTLGIEIESTMSKEFSFGSFYGIEGYLELNRILTISLGVLRTNQNQTYTLKNDQSYYIVKTKIKSQLDYLDFPLLFRFHIKSFYMECGPQMGLLLHAHENYDGSAYRNVTGSFNSFNLMLNGGAGFKWDLAGRLSMTGGFRMGIGLTDVTKEYSSAMKIPEDASIITKLAHIKVENEDWLGILLGSNATYESFSYKKTQRCFIGLNISLRYNLFPGKK